MILRSAVSNWPCLLSEGGWARGRPSPLLSMSKSTRRPAGALPRGWRSLVKLLSLLAYFLSLGRVYSVLPGVFAELIFPIRWGIYTSGQRRMVTGLILHRAA